MSAGGGGGVGWGGVGCGGVGVGVGRVGWNWLAGFLSYFLLFSRTEPTGGERVAPEEQAAASRRPGGRGRSHGGRVHDQDGSGARDGRYDFFSVLYAAALSEKTARL